MPAGASNPELGVIAFGAIKLAGYCLAAKVISKAYQKKPPQVFAIGLTRTVIGVAFGCAYMAALSSLSTESTDFDSIGAAFLIGLVPLRMVEWFILLVVFYDRRLVHRARAVDVIGGGTLWSFLLDVPAIVGLISVVGFWIC